MFKFKNPYASGGQTIVDAVLFVLGNTAMMAILGVAILFIVHH